MTWHALYYPLRPGSDERVKDLFRSSGRPEFDVRDESGTPVGRLLGTMAFVGPSTAVRVMEIEGALPLVAAHMSRQAAVRQFEARLEDHLAVPRDMRSPAGARAFFQQAALRGMRVCVDEQGGPDRWLGVFCRLRAGVEDQVSALVAADDWLEPELRGPAGEVGRVAGSMAFVGTGKALLVVQVDVPARAPASGGHPAALLRPRLEPYLAAVPDAAGSVLLRCVLSRRHDRDI